MKKTKLFDQLDNVIGNHMEGKATDQDLMKKAYEVNRYLIEFPHPHDLEEQPKTPPGRKILYTNESADFINKGFLLSFKDSGNVRPYAIIERIDGTVTTRSIHNIKFVNE